MPDTMQALRDAGFLGDEADAAVLLPADKTGDFIARAKQLRPNLFGTNSFDARTATPEEVDERLAQLQRAAHRRAAHARTAAVLASEGR